MLPGRRPPVEVIADRKASRRKPLLAMAGPDGRRPPQKRSFALTRGFVGEQRRHIDARIGRDRRLSLNPGVVIIVGVFAVLKLTMAPREFDGSGIRIPGPGSGCP